MKKISFFVFFVFLTITASSQSSQNLTLVGEYEYNAEGNDIWGYVDPVDSTEYALVGLYNAFSVVNLSNPSLPVEEFQISGDNSIWRDIKVWNNYAYVVADQGNDGLLIVDLNDMSGSTYLFTTVDNSGNSIFTHAHNIYIDEFGKAYIFGGDVGTVGGALILDVTTTDLSTNTLPTTLGLFDDFYLHDGMARGDTLWGSAINNGNLWAIDVSTPSSPVIFNSGVAFHPTPHNFTHNCWVSDDGKTVFTTDEKPGAYIAAYDVSDLNNITELDRVQSNPGSDVIPHNVHVLDNFLVTSYYRDGIVVHDATYPNAMVEVAHYDTYPMASGSVGASGGFDGSWGAYPWLPSGLILSCDINSSSAGSGMLVVLQPDFDQACYLEGEVTDASTSGFISSATVEILTSSTTASTNAVGEYMTGVVYSGVYEVVFSAPGYFNDTLTASLSNGVLTTLNASLVPMMAFSGTGVVVDNNGNGISNAQVLFNNSGFGINTLVTADASGTFYLDTLYIGLYEVEAGQWGYVNYCDEINVLNDGSIITIQLTEGYYDDFTFDFGWSTSGNASTGFWEKGEPNGTSSQGDQVQTDEDVNLDCSSECYVTGNSSSGGAGADDVDDAEVILTSPVFDLSSAITPYVNYYRWFANTGGNGSPDDSLKVSITNGSVEQTIELTTSSSTSLAQWVSVSQQITIPLTSSMQIKVYTADFGSGHLVEAAFDMFSIEDHGSTAIVDGKKEIDIYPNPSNDLVKVQGAEKGLLQVFNAIGEMVFEKEKTDLTLTFSVSNFTAGVYLVKLEDQFLKLVVQ